MIDVPAWLRGDKIGILKGEGKLRLKTRQIRLDICRLKYEYGIYTKRQITATDPTLINRKEYDNIDGVTIAFVDYPTRRRHPRGRS